MRAKKKPHKSESFQSDQESGSTASGVSMAIGIDGAECSQIPAEARLVTPVSTIGE